MNYIDEIKAKGGISLENFSFQKTIECKDDSVFRNCNFTQEEPRTAIEFTGKNIKLIDCNLTNCEVPREIELENCNIHNTEKSLTAIQADIKAAEIPPEKTYTKEDVKTIFVTAGLLKTTDVVTKVEDIASAITAAKVGK